MNAEANRHYPLDASKQKLSELIATQGTKPFKWSDDLGKDIWPERDKDVDFDAWLRLIRKGEDDSVFALPEGTPEV